MTAPNSSSVQASLLTIGVWIPDGPLTADYIDTAGQALAQRLWDVLGDRCDTTPPARVAAELLSSVEARFLGSGESS